MDRKKYQLTNSFYKLKADALKAGLSRQEVENILLSMCSEEARAQRFITGSLAESSGDRASEKSGERLLLAGFGTFEAHSIHKSRVVFSAIACIVVAVLYLHLYGHLQSLMKYLQQTDCLLEANFLMLEIARPIEQCDFCEGVETFPTYLDISLDEFLEKHAYTGRPALISEGGTHNWTAVTSFSFTFLRDLYRKTPNALAAQEGCQFFPYNTDFETFEEFLNMSERRAALKEDNWYVGWSNCDSGVMAELRTHYTRPHFLPQGSESSAIDWIFMGGPGVGANVHIDSVDRPSWQAQVRGSKTWTLFPPPECEHVCHQLSATMTRGNVIVVDTNRWYHKTDILPGDISITIGSEYD